MNKIAHSLLSPVKFILGLDFLVALALIAVFLISSALYQPIKLEVSVLVPDSSLQVTRPELLNHNANLISTLQSRESQDANSSLSQNSGLVQSRNIYIVFVAALLTFLFRKNDTQKPNTDNKKPLFVILGVIVLFVYARCSSCRYDLQILRHHEDHLPGTASPGEPKTHGQHLVQHRLFETRFRR